MKSNWVYHNLCNTEKSKHLVSIKNKENGNFYQYISHIIVNTSTLKGKRKLLASENSSSQENASVEKLSLSSKVSEIYSIEIV